MVRTSKRTACLARCCFRYWPIWRAAVFSIVCFTIKDCGLKVRLLWCAPGFPDAFLLTSSPGAKCILCLLFFLRELGGSDPYYGQQYCSIFKWRTYICLLEAHICECQRLSLVHAAFHVVERGRGGAAIEPHQIPIIQV